MAKCLSCSERKGKRSCPALEGMICSQCCGSKREVEIQCPPDCSYLAHSKQFLTEKHDSRQLADFERQMKSIIGNEGMYMDILQNIEFAIVEPYREGRNITDRDVQTALEYLMEVGKAQLNLPSNPQSELPFKIQSIVDSIEDVLEMRKSIVGQKEDIMRHLKCIYRVLYSVRTHYSPDDERSYLNFIAQYIK